LWPFTGRDRELRELASGHLANPMNQAWLSQLPLHSLREIYELESPSPEAQFARACRALCPPALAEALLEDAAKFQHEGLARFSAELNEELLGKYSAFNHPMASEVCDWLRGEYRFDPACLT